MGMGSSRLGKEREGREGGEEEVRQRLLPPTTPEADITTTTAHPRAVYRVIGQ